VCAIGESVRFLEDKSFDQTPTVPEVVAPAFAPLIEIALKFAKHPVFVHNIPIVEHFAVPILFLLKSLPKQYWVNHFESANESDQIALLELLQQIFFGLVSADGLPDPSEPFPRSKSRLEELSLLKTAGRKIDKHVNYTFINEYFTRTAQFLWAVSERPLSSQKVMSAAGDLFSVLLGHHQHRSNFAAVLITLARFCDAHGALLYGTLEPAVRRPYQIGWELAMRQLQVAKASGVAFLIHLLYRSHIATGSLFCSGYACSEQVISDFLQAPQYKVNALSTSLELMEKFVFSFRMPNFVEGGLALLKGLRGAVNCLPTRNPKDIAVSFKFLAKLYEAAPLERLHWLKSVATLSEKENVLLVAFRAQVRAAALVYFVLVAKKEKIAKADFLSLGLEQEETVLDIKKYPDIGKEQFTVPLLVETIDRAVQLGEKSAELGQKGPDADAIRDWLAKLKPIRNAYT
jgi:hypothetical protein